MHKWFWIIGWFPTALAVAGNAIVIWLITTRRRLRTTANWFVMSLAVADLCIGLFLFPTMFTCKSRWYSCTVHHEHIISTCLSFFLHASVANLCAMTTDRYIAIALPLKYITYMTPRRCTQLITAAWIFPAVVWILYTALIVHFAASTTVVAVNIIIKCTLQIIPGVFLTIATLHMLMIVRRHKKEISTLLADLRYNRHTSEASPSVVRRSPETSSATVIGVVVFAFVLCYCVENYFAFCHICPLVLVDVVLLFLLINAAANPLAYAFLKKDIRREVKRLIRCNTIMQANS
ncbi:octopamine receptor beta-2R-like [Oculina patagonica]